jgi:hypothetical protein
VALPPIVGPGPALAGESTRIFVGLAAVPLEAQSQYVILRRPILGWPDNCFEFLLTDASAPEGMRLAWYLPPLVGRPGTYLLDDLAARQGWQIDPVAHPLGSTPFASWEAADYAMTVLSRFGGDFYQCLGRRSMEMPNRVQAPAPPPGVTPPGTERYCVLRKADLYQPGPLGTPAVCFEFYLADLGRRRHP